MLPVSYKFSYMVYKFCHIHRVFIRHWRLENSPSTTQNSPAKFCSFPEKALLFHNNNNILLLHILYTVLLLLQFLMKTLHTDVTIYVVSLQLAQCSTTLVPTFQKTVIMADDQQCSKLKRKSGFPYVKC